MNSESFVLQRQAAWRELGEIVDLAQRRGQKKLGAAKALRLLDLYRQTSSDLARLRTLKLDSELERKINRLVIRAHGQIYMGRESSRSSQWSMVDFFVRRLPEVFRQTWRYTLFAFILCSAVYGMAYILVQQHPEIIADIMGGMESEFTGPKKPEDIIDRFQQTHSSVLSASVTTNNIQVAMLAFAMGITFGLGTLYVLIVNSAMLGGIAGAFARSDIESVLWATILPHGALELSAIVVAGAAGLVIGHALWAPGRRTRSRALQEQAIPAAQLAIGLVPAFIVAGFFEGFVTPSLTLPGWLKISLGTAVAIFFWVYLIFTGLGRKKASE